MTNPSVTVKNIYLRKNDRGILAPLTPSQTPDELDDYKYQIKTLSTSTSKDISILSGAIVGTRYYDYDRVKTFNNQPGFLLKEPENVFDNKAIAVYRYNWFGKGIKVGYVASVIANTVYRYLDNKTKVTLDDCGMPYFLVK